MVATLYHIPKTISSPIVQILLELNLVNDPIIVEEITFPSLKTKRHLAINPMGTCPAFRDTDLDITIWESGAVLTYILERYDTEYQFYPKPINDPSLVDHVEHIKMRAKFLHVQQYIIATVYPFVATVYLHSLQPKEKQDMVYMDAAKHKCMTIIGPILVQLLGDMPYFLGDHISAIDFLAIKPFRNLHSLYWLHEFPTLLQFFERVTNRPTYIEAYDGIDSKTIIRDQSIILVPTKTKHQMEQHPSNNSSSLSNKSKYDSTTSSTNAIDNNNNNNKKRFTWSNLRNKSVGSTTSTK